MISQKLKNEYILIVALIVNFAVKVLADFYSGFHGDELLHIDAGNHLAFGYMDFSPIIAWLAGIQNLFHSDSIFVNHLFVYVASAVIMLLCGLIVIELGGKNPALIITLSCLLFSPGLLASRGLFLPVIFEQTTWILCIYWLIKFQNTEASKYLYLLRYIGCNRISFQIQYCVFIGRNRYFRLTISNETNQAKKVVVS